MGSRVELFEQIRRDREQEGLSIRALAERHGVHRRTVRQALAAALPPPRKQPDGRPAPKLGPHRALIDSWLAADREAPRKQRHTARRVWERLVDEQGAEVSERQVRRYVRARRRELGEPVDEVYVPQVHEPGIEAEVDWGEAQVVIAGQRRTVYLFLMRACYSGAAFVLAFERESQQAFLEAQVEALRFFGGFATVRYEYVARHIFVVLCPTGLCGRRLSRAGFDGDLDSRMLSWGEEILRCHVETEEVSRGAVGARRAAGVRVGPTDRACRG
jgi:transposase